MNDTRVRDSQPPRKASSGQVVQINHQITRKRSERATQTIFVQTVRERIAHDWRRGKLSADLANLYRGVPRKELERIAHEELFGQKGKAA